MRRYLLTLLLLFLFCSVSHGQTPSPDSGGVKDSVYSNTFFGFSYAFPNDWIIQGEATNAKIKELGEQRAKETHALPDAAVEVALARTYQLLTVVRRQLGTVGIMDNAMIQVVAESVGQAPAITSGRDYLQNVHDVLIKMGTRPLHEDPVKVVFSNQKFFRLDFEQTENGQPIHSAMLVIVSKGYALVFIFTSGDQKRVEETIKTMESFKFSVPPATPEPIHN